jgi:hypothetical protein
MIHVPELEPHCGSWTVCDRETGEGVVEIFRRSIVEKVNANRYYIETTLQYLCRMNAAIYAEHKAKGWIR